MSFSVVQATNITLVYTIDVYRPIAGEITVTQHAFKCKWWLRPDLSFVFSRLCRNTQRLWDFSYPSTLTRGLKKLGIKSLSVLWLASREDSFYFGFLSTCGETTSGKPLGDGIL